MTPLAAYLAEQLCRPPSLRDAAIRQDYAGVRSALDDAHYFDCRATLAITQDITNFRESNPNSFEETSGDLLFLPAPNTWIEVDLGSGGRMCAISLRERAGRATVDMWWKIGRQPIGQLVLDRATSWEARLLPDTRASNSPTGLEHKRGLLDMVGVILILINSPRIIGRQQHMPNGALEAKLNKKFGGGSFPLRAWTEIKLEVNKPPDIDDGEPHEAHLTGRRALHFCRKHIRVKNGRLEYVRAHWRGDASLGIKQSRYKLESGNGL